jgi:FkbM family methyltransferase
MNREMGPTALAEVHHDSHGFRFLARPHEYPYMKGLLQRDCDTPTFEAYRRLLRDGDTCVDVGAHVGRYAVFPARLVGESGRVYALEPNEETFWALKANIALNRCVNISAHQLGLAARPGRAQLHLYEPQFSSWSSLNPHPMVRPDGSRCVPSGAAEVEIDTLDNFARRMGITQIDLLKLDVEGVELDVLSGASELLAAGAVRHICFEISEVPLAGSGHTVQDVMEFFLSRGFSIYTFERTRGAFSGPLRTVKTYQDNFFASREPLERIG